MKIFTYIGIGIAGFLLGFFAIYFFVWMSHTDIFSRTTDNACLWTFLILAGFFGAVCAVGLWWSMHNE